MKSFMAKKGQVENKWLVVDADGAVLGRLAAKIAPVLMGKNKPTYTPHVDTGDYVIVVNAEKIKVTGKKAQAKEYLKNMIIILIFPAAISMSALLR
jgi:large subunit ribosomal protein L13